jgi:hypothetical protein
VQNGSALSAFNSNGFSIGGNNAGMNKSGDNFVSWNWKAGGATVSNTDGSITSTVSANVNAGFSIVSYTGNGTSGATIGHGLSVAPEVVIVKNRSLAGEHWVVSVGNITGTGSDFLVLSASSAIQSSGQFTVGPGSSTFTVATAPNVNANNDNYIAYCFNNVDGYSKFGSYIGNGSTNGTFINTGFKPAYVLIKNAGASSTNWRLTDIARSPFNTTDAALHPNTSAVEFGENDMDILSNGFKLRQSSIYVSQTGVSFIYMAFAETPFKNTTAH